MYAFNNLFTYFEDVSPDKEKVKSSIELFAYKYIEYIKSIQPTGPYHFFGASLGGVQALEITRQLFENFYDIVPNLFIVDSPFEYRLFTQSLPLPITTFLSNYVPVFSTRYKESKSNIVFYKAGRPWEKYPGFWEFYKTTPTNHLDRLIGDKPIEVIVMHDDDHSSWYNNHQLHLEMANKIVSSLNETNFERLF